MYHRYQPTENGRFQRQTIPDAQEKARTALHGNPAVPPRKQEPSGMHMPAEQPAVVKMPHKDPDGFPPPRFQLPFLEKLLPNMDSGDLLLLLIMLLLISEGNEDSSSVVMTLAIFLFLQ